MNKNKSMADRIEEEHASLRSLMESVTETFNRPPTGDAKDWKLGLVWELRDLRHMLVKHFDFEEDGGFMGDVVETAPRESRRVDMLESEHGEFLSEVDDITAELKRMTNSSGIDRTRERLKKLISRLHTHEASERDLIGTVYFQDLGSGT
jgi:hemerythrin-like domain-containing protein